MEQKTALHTMRELEDKIKSLQPGLSEAIKNMEGYFSELHNSRLKALQQLQEATNRCNEQIKQIKPYLEQFSEQRLLGISRLDKELNSFKKALATAGITASALRTWLPSSDVEKAWQAFTNNIEPLQESFSRLKISRFSEN